MSAEATGWVFRHSPQRGAARLVHLAIADSVNDQNENEFWMSLGRLAEKCLMERASVSRIVKTLTEGGFLTLLQDNTKARKPSRYRFEFPLQHVSSEHMTRVNGTHAHVSTEHANPITTQENPTNTSEASFEAFWGMYPRRESKGRARLAWRGALKKTDAETILKALVTYAASRLGEDPQFTAMPTTWLNGERWLDEPLPAHQTNDPRGVQDVHGNWHPREY